MKSIGNLAALVGAVLSVTAAGYAAPAAAQATRTWVSGVGDDVNPCSRTAPCKTFAGAISKTAAGGQINCIDSGGFGTVTITKAIAIQCDQIEAGVLGSSTTGIVINAGPTDAIFLSGMDIHGGGTGLNGVRFLAGGALHINNSKIRRFGGANANGVIFAPSSGTAKLYITDTIIAENGSTNTGGGILVAPSGTGSAFVVLDNVRVENNANNAFKIDTSGGTGLGVSGQIRRSIFTGSTNGVAVTTGTPSAVLQIDDSLISLNTSGIVATGVGSTVRVGDTTITGNATASVLASSGKVFSYGDNRVDGNTNNGTFTAPALVKK